LVRLPWRYRWSSAAAHCGDEDSSGALDFSLWRRRYEPKQWRSILLERDDDLTVLRLRRTTINGRPLGSDRFVAKLEAALNRRLRPAKAGRPRRELRSESVRKKR